MGANNAKDNLPSGQELDYLLYKILQQRQQDIPAIINTAFFHRPTITPHYKNRHVLYRLRGKGLVLLQTNFIKKPKNPV